MLISDTKNAVNAKRNLYTYLQTLDFKIDSYHQTLM